MKTNITLRTFRTLMLILAIAFPAFAAKAQDGKLLWKTDRHYINTFRAMSQSNTPACFVSAQAADAEAVFNYGTIALAFEFNLEDDISLSQAAYLGQAVIESGKVHFMPFGKSVHTAEYSYCDYEGSIGKEHFGMRQYYYSKGGSICTMRIIHKTEISKTTIFKAVEEYLLGSGSVLAKQH